ncbi:bifunctional protein-serine/threonine kinase/phosphatase [Tropicibacter naphthalenivorans]|uniref:Serine/threonine-protein kinase StkP n=1 Tax=Tropicibacter naphthalenivorans TaxID=441103 RepID=A0A0P1GWU9_9RHOB|nr:bifunctional protein-serine/threonine kinase/phosphatase [Tropicibacter naphthalenivorans]CUH79800.1 Serine/threonine-protein kinase StkP [Tropicibacter naphthalenivorans]SMC75245.1 Serine/threonine protein kinase [Tropicibacter naphthalenivorans]
MPRDTGDQAQLTVSIGAYSAAGRKPLNQDFHGALIPGGEALTHKGIVLAVADGISSSATSREAAETSVKALLTDYYATSDAWTVRNAATQVIRATNAWLHGQNRSVTDINAGRVCTLSALILKGRTGHVLHVGDSRVARLTGDSLEPLTLDHRVTLSATESYLGRGMGIEPHLDVDYRKVDLRPGDVFLLTTDGVHDFIDTATVRAALLAPDLDAAAQQIAEHALAIGSDDNLTVQIVRIEALPDSGDALAELDSLPLPPLPNAGDMLDDYRIIRPIHASARSHVYLAAGPDGTQVALKIPASETAEDGTYLKRFMLEEWIARRVKSPHVVKVPPQRARTSLYIVSEYVQGVTLREWMADHPGAPLTEVRGIIDQIAMGLRALHRREMIHQDLRPENVMIDADGTAKIIDLGSVAVAGVEEAAPGLLGQMPGTYQYTAPEYLTGDAASWRSDQYALACIAYEMLTGRLPYGTRVAQITSRRDAARLTYTPAHDETNAVPLWVDAALKRALHPDPLRRYNALSEFQSDLHLPGAQALRPVPLMARSPLRFWQSLSAALALLCLFLILQLAT